MNSTYNEGIPVVAERFIRTLKNKIFKHMRAISKNVYFDVLCDIVNKYNNTVHRTIKMKPTDVTFDSYAEQNEDSHVTSLNSTIVLGFQNIIKFLLKDILKIGQKKFLSLAKLKSQFRGLMLLANWMLKKLLEVFMKRNCKKLVKKNIRIEKIIKRKGDKLYVKWKGYDNSFNSWNDKKDHEWKDHEFSFIV